MLKKINFEKCYSITVLSLVLLMLLMPSRGIFQYIFPAAFFCIWFLYCVVVRKCFTINRYVIVFFSVWLFCLFAGQLVVVGETNINSFSHELLRVGLYIVIVLPISICKFDKKHVTFLCSIFILINLFIQFLELINVEFIFSFIKKFYLLTNDMRHLNLAQTQNVFNFRSGSIFVNPNVYSPLAIISVSFIISRLEKNIETKKYLFEVLLFGVAGCGIVSLLLTGSRTALISICVMLVYFFIRIIKYQPLISFLIFVGMCLALTVLILFGSRSISISNGIQDSFGVKTSELLAYFKEVNKLSLFVGNNSNIGSTKWGYDFEWGYVIVYTGFVGLINYFSLHYNCVKKYLFSNKDNLYIYFLIGFVVQTLSATVLYNSHAFPLFALIAFSEGFYEKN